VDAIPGASIHDGGRLAFGPDGKLYATTGDATQRALAQRLDSLAGKILRLNPDGSVPADNPFPGSYVFSYGHRNPQGLAWHPQTGRLYSTEHGPTGEMG
ncbi:MAG: glucose sorbosone dehydrogenase, partial [Thermoflexus sp.]